MDLVLSRADVDSPPRRPNVLEPLVLGWLRGAAGPAGRFARTRAPGFGAVLTVGVASLAIAAVLTWLTRQEDLPRIQLGLHRPLRDEEVATLRANLPPDFGTIVCYLAGGWCLLSTSRWLDADRSVGRALAAVGQVALAVAATADVAENVLLLLESPQALREGPGQLAVAASSVKWVALLLAALPVVRALVSCGARRGAGAASST